MYKGKLNRWLKHFDFILLDLLTLEFSYMLALFIRFNYHLPRMTAPVYKQQRLIILICYLILVLAVPLHRDVLKRKLSKELTECAKVVILCLFLDILYLYAIKKTGYFSRQVFGEFWVLSTLFMWGARVLYKIPVKKRIRTKGDFTRMLLVTEEAKLVHNYRAFARHAEDRYLVAGVFLSDYDPDIDYHQLVNQSYKKKLPIDVLGGFEDIYPYIADSVVDEVMIDITDPVIATKLSQDYLESGLVIHINLNQTFGDLPNQIIEKLGGTTCMTSSLNVASPIELAIKRLMDICGSVVGLAFTLIGIVILGPVIKIQSPGPLFYSQTRVGAHGRKFKIYKFRSMYPDADKRLEELKEKNKLGQDGLMFKMDDDPRIIPIGHFIRRYSIDELPQFYNILKGDMSLVGTRPPTVEEWDRYHAHHRARLAFRPGLTGMWQVSGRSNITDFENVVKLDTQYIKEWTLFLDIKILLKTLWVVFKSEGAV